MRRGRGGGPDKGVGEAVNWWEEVEAGWWGMEGEGGGGGGGSGYGRGGEWAG